MTLDTDLMSRRARQDPDVIVTELDDGEAVLLHLGSRKYFSLNKTGVEIWHLLGEDLTLAAVGERLLATYDITPEHALSAISNLTGRLLEAGLIQLEG